MKLKFYKYEGAGNDFILVDNRENLVDPNNADLNSRLCHRHFGIGADGIMFLQNKEGFDFEMLYFNADGRPSTMCGNGGRCITAFAKHLCVMHGEATFLAVDGPHHAKISEDGTWVSLKMIDVDTVTTDGEAFVLNTGSPHYILPTDQLREKDVYKEGKTIRNSDTYRKEGINVNFVEDLGNKYLVRTFERGVEDETFACGTGATAVALAMAKHKQLTGDITTPIEVLGGNLIIRFHYDGQRFTNIYLEGPAKFVFSGEIEI
ncbi:MAG: dapF [Sphingobacteriaceae bacterium]|jgi:diaminopimelate epimerase|nr:dapF [Sphingobacteriaceae bacterium]